LLIGLGHAYPVHLGCEGTCLQKCAPTVADDDVVVARPARLFNLYDTEASTFTHKTLQCF